MKKWNKLLALLLALVMALGLAACGNGADDSSTAPAMRGPTLVRLSARSLRAPRLLSLARMPTPTHLTPPLTCRPTLPGP